MYVYLYTMYYKANISTAQSEMDRKSAAYQDLICDAQQKGARSNGFWIGLPSVRATIYLLFHSSVFLSVVNVQI